jgi:hypothetical protein
MRLRLTLVCVSAFAAVCARAQQGGQAQVAIQGYYQGGASQSPLNTTGFGVKLQEFLPNLGLLTGSLGGYRSGGDVQPADNSLELRGLRYRGLRWTLGGGDVRAPASPLRNSFTNLFLPELNVRGFEIEAGNSRSAYTFFFGHETVLGGPRIPLRIDVPQTAMGLSTWQRFGKLEAGLRLLHLATSEKDLDANPNFFPASRRFLSADNLTLYSSYNSSDNFRWYGEATVARATAAAGEPGGQPFSFLFGPVGRART